MSRIAARFEELRRARRKALIPYITAGDPSPPMTLPLLHALVEAGADIVELGVPFSDPMADGPVIQRSGERALKHGVGLADVLGMVEQFRARDRATPIVLMGYANPIEAMGPARFLQRAKAAGIDGVIVVDYPPEECVEFAQAAKQHDIDPIFPSSQIPAQLTSMSMCPNCSRTFATASGMRFVSARSVTIAIALPPDFLP